MMFYFISDQSPNVLAPGLLVGYSSKGKKFSYEMLIKQKRIHTPSCEVIFLNKCRASQENVHAVYRFKFIMLQFTYIIDTYAVYGVLKGSC